MRTLEIILVFYSLIILFGLGAERIRASQAAFLYPLGLIALVGLYLFIEGPRWQLAPVLLAALPILVGWGYALIRREWALTTGMSLGLGLGLGLLILLGAALAALIPVAGTPEPSGAFSVGTLTYDWSDPFRGELWNESGGSYGGKIR